MDLIDQKGLIMYKGQKVQFLDLKYLFLAEFKGVPPPLSGKNPLSIF